MISLLLAATVAMAAPDGDAALYDRLLGPDDGSEATAAAPAAPDTALGTPWWLSLLLAGGAAAGVWYTKRRQGAAPTQRAALQVTTRLHLGGSAGLAVVELRDRGTVQRWLVGTGTSGPVLLTTLDAEQEPVDTYVPAAAEPAPRRPSFEPHRPAPAATPRRQTAAPTPLVGPQGSIEERRRAARSLIDEALARRENGAATRA